MTSEHREALMKAIVVHGRRMKRDKKYALQFYVRLGMMTRKGNLTKNWQQIKKSLGVIPRHYEAIQRARVTC